MNAKNQLRSPAYFIPDPWTKTPSDGSFASRALSSSISQVVNDNSNSKITLKSLFNLFISFFVHVRISHYFKMFKYAISSIGKPWRKALFLDMLLFEIHKSLFKQKCPNFTTLFLNAGAHIQHHYLFNSPYVESNVLKNPSWYISSVYDPCLEMLVIYDKILGEIFKLTNTEFIIATGLSQKPYENLKFYYRLKDHSKFLDFIGLDYLSVTPRMTRDFLVSFSSSQQALIGEKLLSNIYVDKEHRLFGEIDNRGSDIFVVLTYPNEINDSTTIHILDNELFLNEHVTFVAIKNGEHQSKGFAYYSKGLSVIKPADNSHVSSINKTVLDFFNISS